jgi:hypothetical protein
MICQIIQLFDELGDGCPLILYVDDMFLTRDEKLIVGCKRELALEFKMKDLGLMHYFLGLEVWQRSDEISLSQGKYTVEILKTFKMMDCKSMATPMMISLKLPSESSSDLVDPTMYIQLIGSLMYMVNTRSDICLAVNASILYMVKPRHVHWLSTKHMLRYLCGTIEYGLRYGSNGYVKVQGYTNSDWAGSAMDRKSTSGYCFNLGLV